jgi:FKBP-type peptidyl-prolyl cis-trans isomerase 2
MADKQKISKKDFVELEFLAKIKNSNEVFDTNIPEEAKKINLNIKEIKPFVLSVGSGMVIKGLDEALEGKQVGEKYILEFTPENAFGKREKSLVKMVPMKVFESQKIFPQRGMQFNLDGMLARVISVSGGRVLLDFNNPLAGKAVIYDIKINKKIDDIKEKINALQDFFFKQRFEFNVDEKNKKVSFKMPENLQVITKIFENPFKDILDLIVEAEIPAKEKDKDKKEEKKEEKK